MPKSEPFFQGRDFGDEDAAEAAQALASVSCLTVTISLSKVLEEEIRKALCLPNDARMSITSGGTHGIRDGHRWTVSGEPDTVRKVAAFLQECGMGPDNIPEMNVSNELEIVAANGEITLFMFLINPGTV